MDGRPRVVVSVTVSVDGKLTTRREALLLRADAAREWDALMPGSAARVQGERETLLERELGPQAFLEGSGSFVPEAAGPLSGLPPAAGDEELGDFLPGEVVDRPGRRKWFVVVDGRGRVRWTRKRDGDQDLLVLVARDTPRDYRAYLRREGICQLVAGRERVDLGLALRRLRAELGVTGVVVTGGGGLQGALLRAGLIDEVQLVVVPVAIGGTGTPALFDGPAGLVTPLQLMSSRAEPDGVLWLRYRTRSPENPQTPAGAPGGR